MVAMLAQKRDLILAIHNHIRRVRKTARQSGVALPAEKDAFNMVYKKDLSLLERLGLKPTYTDFQVLMAIPVTDALCSAQPDNDGYIQY